MTVSEKISKTRLAALLGVTKGRVSQMISLGMPVEADGSVDLAVARRWIAENIDRPDPVTSDTFQQAKLIRMIFSGKLLRLEFERRQAKLIDAEGVRTAIAGHVATLRESLSQFADRLAPLIAQESDSKKIHKMLRAEIIAELHRISALVGEGGSASAQPRG